MIPFGPSCRPAGAPHREPRESFVEAGPIGRPDDERLIGKGRLIDVTMEGALVSCNLYSHREVEESHGDFIGVILFDAL